MKTVTLTIPEFMFVVGTRAILGAGVALLLAPKLPDHERRSIGRTLALVGLLTTIPAAMAVFRRAGERRGISGAAA